MSYAFYTYKFLNYTLEISLPNYDPEVLNDQTLKKIHENPICVF